MLHLEDCITECLDRCNPALILLLQIHVEFFQVNLVLPVTLASQKTSDILLIELSKK